MYFIHSVPMGSPCSSCGTTLLEISQTGKLGCPECYRHYSQHLNYYIRRIHGPAVHTGRIPKSAGGYIVKKRRISELRNALKNAVEQQEFERCAELRDEINALSGEEGTL